MKSFSLHHLAACALTFSAAASAAVQTPEQRANPLTGEIPHPGYGQEYYLGQVGRGSTQVGELVGGVYPNESSVSWYKYVSDGTSPVIFDLAGSSFSFGFGGFTGGPDGELAVYDSQGNFIAGNENPQVPTTGDSNLSLPSVPQGAAAPGYRSLHAQPKDPTKPVATYSASSNSWSNGNAQGLSQLAFVKDPQSNPAPSTGDWNQYPILPAGEYFLAVTGYSTYFAGNPRDTSAIDTYGADNGGITPQTPFGFVSFHAMSGTSVLNVRLAGDFDTNGTIDLADLQLLQDQITALVPENGISPAGFNSGIWVGLPSDLQAFDLTYNGRIDQYDVDAFIRYTGVPEPAALTALLSGAVLFLRRNRQHTTVTST